MNKKKQLLIATLLVTAGVVAAYIAFATKPQAQTDKPVRVRPRAQIQVVSPSQHQIQVVANGKVVPAQRTIVTSEVAGTIIYKNPDLEPGARVKKGETLVRVDPSTYKLQVESQQANLLQAKLNLQLEEAQQKIAEHDAHRLAQEIDGDDLDLALRKPHLLRAQAALSAAQSALEEAKLNLAKTRVQAPYNAVITNVPVEVGSLLAPQRPVATLVGTNELWAKVSIPVTKLNQIQLPDSKGDGGSKAVIQQFLGQSGSIKKPGRVTRILGELDPLGHMAQLIVSIKDPFTSSATPMLPGANVVVTIEGKEQKNIFKLPRQAIFDDQYLWRVNSDNTLSLTKIAIAWKDKNDVFIKSGLKNKDRVVVSPLRAPVDGMQIMPMKAL